jgi:uncharacterized protein GlcG (DUF336 family)
MPTANMPKFVSSNAFRAFLLAGIAAIACGQAYAQATITVPPQAAEGGLPGPNQGVVSQRTLSLGLAMTIANATIGECRAKGAKSAVVVLDRSGQILVALRDEEAPPNTVEMARRKAYTSRMFNTTTAEFQKNTMPDSPRSGQRDVPDILALSGGVPVKIGNEIIGTVGSSGSGLEADDACAKAGVAKVADLLK